MRALGRALLGAFALLLAIPAGIVFLMVAAAFEPNLRDIVGRALTNSVLVFWDALSQTGDFGGAVAAFGIVSTIGLSLFVAPPALVGLLGEIFGWRAFAWYAGATGAATAFQPFAARAALKRVSEGEARVALALFLAGATAGTVYWLIAGRSAGRRPAPEFSAPRSPGS